MDAEINKKAQVTIFIIVAILVVVGIAMIFILKKSPDVKKPDNLNPRNYIDKCVRDAVDKSVDRVLFNGGEISPTRAIMWRGNKWNYLCYNADYYQTCYNIHPMLELQIENEISANTSVDVEKCFDEMKDSFQERGFDVDMGNTNYSVDLVPGSININLNKKIKLSKDGVSQAFEDFDSHIPSPIYELVQIARTIVNSESQYCYFEYNGYMLLYPKYDIRVNKYQDSKLYRVIDRRSGDEFKFAVRGCVIPPGI